MNVILTYPGGPFLMLLTGNRQGLTIMQKQLGLENEQPLSGMGLVAIDFPGRSPDWLSKVK